MSKLHVAVLALVSGAAFLTGPAGAHGPTRQKVEQSIEISASVDKVWAVVGNFHDMSWDPLVAKTEGGGGNTVSSMRTLTLKAGGTLEESLEKYDATEHTYATFLPHNDPKVLPVTNFSTVLTVTAGDGGKTTVEWRGAGYRGDPNGDPPPELNDDAAVAAITNYLKTGLEGLKKKVEGAGS